MDFWASISLTFKLKFSTIILDYLIIQDILKK